MPTNELKLFSFKEPWDKNENAIWIASTVTLNRNLEKFKFPLKLSGEKKNQILSLISKELLANKQLKKPSLLKGEEATPLQKEYLYEHFLCTRSFHQAHQGEGFVTDNSGRFFAGVNLYDHIVLQLTDCQEDIEKTWNTLTKVEIDLGKSLTYAFNSRFGFLTASPKECGTGLLITAYLQVPALIHSGQIEEFLTQNHDDSVTVESLQGGRKEFTGDLVLIRNQYTLGVTEESLISALRSYAMKMIVHEKGARNKIKEEDNAELKDKVSRAYGLLLNSYKLESIEALNSISLLKLGLELGWLSGTDNQALNKLFFDSRRGHLMSRHKKEIELEEIAHSRSEYIHKVLSKVQLKV